MARMARMTRKRLGEILLEEGVINGENLATALGEQRKSGQLLGEILVEMNFATEYDIAKAIVTQFAWPYISLKNYFVKDEVINLIPAHICRQYHIIPMEKMGGVLAIVAGSALSSDILRELEYITGCLIRVYVGTYSDVKEALDKHFGEAAYEPSASPLEGAAVAVAAAPAVVENGAPAQAAPAAARPAAAAAAVAFAQAEQEAPSAPAAPPVKKAAKAKGPEPEKPEPAKAEGEGEELSSLGSMLLGDK